MPPTNRCELDLSLMKTAFWLCVDPAGNWPSTIASIFLFFASATSVAPSLSGAASSRTRALRPRADSRNVYSCGKPPNFCVRIMDPLNAQPIRRISSFSPACEIRAASRS